MSYPFAKAPKWEEFVQNLKSKGVELETIDGELFSSSSNEAISISFFGNDNRTYCVKIESLQDFVTWSQVRSIVQFFELNPKDFDLDLD